MGQDSPHFEPTSATHEASQVSQQQNASVAQIDAMHSAAAMFVAAQALAPSLVPSVQTSCSHVAMPQHLPALQTSEQQSEPFWQSQPACRH